MWARDRNSHPSVRGQRPQCRRGSPKSGAAGRDHWAGVQSVMLAGGGFRHGQVIGSSTAKGEVPKDRPLWPYDIVATMYHHLGIDPRFTPMIASVRTKPLLERGEVIRELL